MYKREYFCVVCSVLILVIVLYENYMFFLYVPEDSPECERERDRYEESEPDSEPNKQSAYDFTLNRAPY